MKIFLALASVSGIQAALSLKSTMQSKASTATKTKASAREAMAAKSLSRYMETIREHMEAKAEKAGVSYGDYDGTDADDEEDDDASEIYGEDGLQHEDIDESSTISVHQFLEADEDNATPEPYVGEDVAQIDADDEETDFGADAPEGEAEGVSDDMDHIYNAL